MRLSRWNTSGLRSRIGRLGYTLPSTWEVRYSLPYAPSGHIIDANICVLADVPLYAFSLFLPSIISSLGYTSTKAQLLSVPPYAAAAILTITVGCGFEFDNFSIRSTSADCLKISPIEHTKEASATSAPHSSEWAASQCSSLGELLHHPRTLS